MIAAYRRTVVPFCCSWSSKARGSVYTKWKLTIVRTRNTTFRAAGTKPEEKVHDAPEECRPGFSGCAAHEYRDTPSVLEKKVSHQTHVNRLGVDYLASAGRSASALPPRCSAPEVAELRRMLIRSRMTICYTGAGLSTAAGIGDYATKGQSTSIHFRL